MTPFSNLKKGLSLIETMIYVAVLVILMTIAVNTSLLLSQSYAGVKVNKDLNNTAVSILERVSREVRWADSIDIAESVFDTTNGILTLNSVDDDNNAIITKFYISDGDLIVEKTGDTAGSLNAGSVDANKFIVSRFDTGISEGVKVELELEGSIKDKTKIVEFYDSAVVRGSYVE